jgi:hypothetical protein
MTENLLIRRSRETGKAYIKNEDKTNGLFNRIYQRRHALDTNFKSVT